MFCQGEYVAVKCKKYKDWPLIGKITTTDNVNTTIDWYVGTYSGTWKKWYGRQDRKAVVFSDNFPVKDILMKLFYQEYETSLYNHTSLKRTVFFFRNSHMSICIYIWVCTYVFMYLDNYVYLKYY